MAISICGSELGVGGTGVEGRGMGKLCWSGCRAATAVGALLFVSEYVPGLSLQTLSVQSF